MKRYTHHKNTVYFMPRILMKTLMEKSGESKLLMDTYFCEHLKIRPCQREFFAKNHVFISHNEANEHKMHHFIRKFKKKNSTLFHYLSKCDTATLETTKKLFKMNKIHANYNQFSKPERCEVCFQKIQQQLITALMSGVLMYESLI